MLYGSEVFSFLFFFEKVIVHLFHYETKKKSSGYRNPVPLGFKLE